MIRIDNVQMLGEDLCELIERYGLAMVEATLMSPLTSSTLKRGSFRLRFADGRTLKGRRFESIAHAQRVKELWRYLSLSNFPALISSHRSAMLIEWIDGQTITPELTSLNLIRRCGILQGQVHSTAIPENICSHFLQSRKAEYDSESKMIQEQIKELRDRGILDRQDVDLVFEVLEANAPNEASFGLVSGDFCGENLVIDSNDNLYIIDNEKTAIDFYDYDLARTYYRWPMSHDERRAYLDGYTEYRTIDSFVENFFYWLIRVIVKSCVFRTKGGTQDINIPISTLKFVIESIKTGKPSEPDIIF